MIPKCLKRAAIMCTICCAVVLQAGLSHAVGTYLDFDDFPVTVGTIPGSTPNWEYSSSVTNNYGYSESASSGWKTTSKLSDGWNWFFDFNRTGKCDSHMYVDTYGFLDIVPKGHSGNALRNTITGGLAAQSTTTCGPPLGTPIYNKESFKGFEQVYKGGKVGHSYIYFKKVEVIGSSRNVTPYKEATDSNRLSAYIYLPPETDNGVGGYNKGSCRPTRSGYSGTLRRLGTTTT